MKKSMKCEEKQSETKAGDRNSRKRGIESGGKQEELLLDLGFGFEMQRLLSLLACVRYVAILNFRPEPFLSFCSNLISVGPRKKILKFD
jgi:hypothetical protein